MPRGQAAAATTTQVPFKKRDVKAHLLDRIRQEKAREKRARSDVNRANAAATAAAYGSVYSELFGDLPPEE